MRITPIILAGGAGERLWPLSKLDYPKQFVRLHAEAPTLFQQAVQRVGDRGRFRAPLIVCNAQHRFIVSEQLRALSLDTTILAEPVARNTAPALALAALHASPEDLLLVVPSDHRITDIAAFLAAVDAGANAAQQGMIVTFSIADAAAESGYGYILRGEALGGGAYRIRQFIEKPEREIAEKLLATGEAGINSGIFLLHAQTALDALAQHAPQVLASCRAAHANAQQREAFFFPEETAFASAPAISIDYAIMEHTDRGVVLPVSMAWSDLGSFTALAELTEKDAQGNALSGNVLADDAQHCFLHSDGPLVAAMGVEDLVVVAADNALLVTHKNRTQDIKPLLQHLRDRASPDLELTSLAHRPWGSFHRIDTGPNYQVKRLHLKPGAKISLQTHTQRSEHWIVIEGRATVTNGEQVTLLEKNQSTYIPAGAVHRLENREDVELVVIEVQTGDYLGEDDIVRLEDSYNRS